MKRLQVVGPDGVHDSLAKSVCFSFGALKDWNKGTFVHSPPSPRVLYWHSATLRLHYAI